MQSRARSSAVSRGLAGVAYPPDDRPVIFLHDEGVQALLKVCQTYAPKNVKWGTERNLAIICMAVFAGLRVNEIRMLDVGDIDLDARAVHVRHAKGGKYRVVPLNQDAFDVVNHYIGLRQAAADDPLFVTSRGRISVRMIQWLVRHLGDELEILVQARNADGDNKVYHLSPHKLRHTFLSSLVNRGEPLIVARDLAGHSSSVTTERYTHSTHTHAAVDSLSKPKDAEPTMSDLLAKLQDLEARLS